MCVGGGVCVCVGGGVVNDGEESGRCSWSIR